MGGPIPTESNINMTGAGLVGKSTSGSSKSGRMSQASVLSWLGLSASGVTDGKALIASSNTIAWSPSAAALLPDTLPAAGTLLSYGGSRQLAAGGTVSHSGALTLGGNINIGANSLVGAYSGVYNGGKWLTGSDGYGAFWISPNNAGFWFAPPAAGTEVVSIDYVGRVNATVGLAVGHPDNANTTVRYYRNATGPKASIRAAGGLEVRNLAGSADAAITAGAATFSGDVVASGAVMETPTQSTINPTTVNIPTGQRRGWYNSTLAEFRDWVNIGGTLLKSAAYT